MIFITITLKENMETEPNCCLQILIHYVHEDLYKDRDLFDNSDYSKDSKFYFDENEKK